jgi:arylsulfatase A-like enzyme
MLLCSYRSDAASHVNEGNRLKRNVPALTTSTERRDDLTRRRLLKAALVGASLLITDRIAQRAGAIPTTAARRPNILLLVTDDQRADSLSCAGNPVLKTPNIDVLANNGVRFRNSFATTAICMSSRASILTGMYTRVHGVDDFIKPLPTDLFQQSYPMQLRRAGYRTGFIGKWGIDGGTLPTDHYDFFKGYQGQGSYFNPETGRHETMVKAEQAVEFLRSSKPDQPFCLQVSFKAPHVQDEGRAMPGIYAKYPYDRALEHLYQEDVVPPVRTRDATAQPHLLDKTLNRTREAVDFEPVTYQETMKDLYRLISGVDQAVGKITAELKSLGMDDNTVILYTSDHGSFYGEHGFGGKWLMHEESIRTPMILYDPRRSANLRGRTCDGMVLNLDVPATLLDLAGLPTMPAMQGKSLLPLANGGAVPWRTEWFYENHFRNHAPGLIAASEGVRTSEWKYVRYIDADPVVEQLFHLPSDPREENDLVGDSSRAAVLDQLRQRWAKWNQALSKHDVTRRWIDPA